MAKTTPGPWMVREGMGGHPEAVETLGLAICHMDEWDDSDVPF